ncbi:MAG: aminodeoxychorismate synthase component I [Elusimicrobia bacterium]|nr:aminodeoxychorismate synthase component I [Elusimicrobiota bacterium]
MPQGNVLITAGRDGVRSNNDRPGDLNHVSNPTALFESRDSSLKGWSGSFGRPRAVRQADSFNQVRPLLRFVEDHVRAGRWGVILLSYEGASALHSSLTTQRSGSFPLAWGAVFDGPQTNFPLSENKFQHSPWRPALASDPYRRTVRRIQNRIARGDTYQVNFTFPLRARWAGDPRAWYQRLAEAQGAPYSAYVDMGRWKILSLSPELFFEKQGSLLTVRPMKGSAPRGRWEKEDDSFARTLRASAKERAENVMIVDLLRNDLGKIAQTGTLRTTRLFQPEPYPTLWQMTSEIKARLRPGVGLVEILEATFPSGSVTGAPKRKTMEIIREMESSPRGLYTGTLGLLPPEGPWTFSVGIRTVTLDTKTGRAVCPVGSGITAVARPSAEYRECLLKGDFLKTPPFQLIETFRLENGQWFLRNGHLQRLQKSADRLGFRYDPVYLRTLLDETANRYLTGSWKVRLLLFRGGEGRVEVDKLLPVARPWRVVLARKPVDERDLFLYHKTTNRAVYVRQRGAHPEADDVILLNRQGELTESTIANLVLEFNGKRYTPPVRCGLLNGVLRDHLVRRGRIQERVLTRADLRRADRVFLINSVRKWIPVEIC